MILYVKKYQQGNSLVAPASNNKYTLQPVPNVVPQDNTNIVGSVNPLNKDKYYNLSTDYIDQLFDSITFKFTPAEDKLISSASIEPWKKDFYKYLKDKKQEKSWKEEYAQAAKGYALETFVDQLPELAKKYPSNPYINNALKLPHINKLKSGYSFFFDGRPLTAATDLLKIPKFSNKYIDLLVNVSQDNPTGYDIKTIEDKLIPAVRLAGINNDHVITKIGNEVVLSNLTLPTIPNAAKEFGVSQNEFVEFIENYMVPSGKSYKQTLEAFKKYKNN